MTIEGAIYLYSKGICTTQDADTNKIKCYRDK